MPSPAEPVQNENGPIPAGKADDFSDKSAIFSETLVWEAIGAGWKPLHGKFAGDGFSVEWHELGQARMDDWGASFHPQSLEICINISGSARLEHDGQTLEIGPRSLAFYSVGEGGIDAIRTASRTGHSFMTIELVVAELGGTIGKQRRCGASLDRGCCVLRIFYHRIGKFEGAVCGTGSMDQTTAGTTVTTSGGTTLGARTAAGDSGPKRF